MATADPPYQDDFAVPENPSDRRRVPKLVPGWRWIQWLSSLVDTIDTAPTRQAFVTKTAQNASLGTTPLPLGDIPKGLYRISYYARVTTAAGVSSALTVTLSWTAGGIALSQSGAVMNGNTTSTFQQDTLVVRSDAATPISYATTYASNAAGAMRYALDLVIEALALDKV